MSNTIHRGGRFSSSARHESTTPIDGSSDETSELLYTQVDWSALLKYSVGLTAQMGLIFGFFQALDLLLGRVLSINSKIPVVVHGIFLYAFNLKTSVFSILPNKRSEQQKLTQDQWAYSKRKIPSWTPPGYVFAIMWPLVTFGLRAAMGAVVVAQNGGRYATVPIMSLMLHLGVANLWNTVNNVERRLGFSVILLYLLWITKAITIVQFYGVKPLAGKLLAITMTWLTAAAALETNTWLINPDNLSGKLEPLVPKKHPKWKTQFRWEQGAGEASS